MKLSEKIQTLRKAAGLSQEQLAERLNVTRQAVSKWETGEGKPDIDTLLPLSRALGATVDYLLDETAAAPQTEMPRDSASEGFIDRCKHLWRRWGFLCGYVLAAIGAFRGAVLVVMLAAPGLLMEYIWGAAMGVALPYYLIGGLQLLVCIAMVIGGLWLAKYLKRKYA